MGYSPEELRIIHARSNGKCHLCHEPIELKHYGLKSKHGEGAWEVDHSNPRANGGSDSRNNLLPAHVSCNRSKGARNNASIRRQHGRTRAPMSQAERERTINGNMFVGAASGALLGLRFGPPGAVVGAIVGAVFASGDPEAAD